MRARVRVRVRVCRLRAVCYVPPFEGDVEDEGVVRPAPRRGAPFLCAAAAAFANVDWGGALATGAVPLAPVVAAAGPVAALGLGLGLAAVLDAAGAAGAAALGAATVLAAAVLAALPAALGYGVSLSGTPTNLITSPEASLRFFSTRAMTIWDGAAPALSAARFLPFRLAAAAKEGGPG